MSSRLLEGYLTTVSIGFLCASRQWDSIASESCIHSCALHGLEELVACGVLKEGSLIPRFGQLHCLGRVIDPQI